MTDYLVPMILLGISLTALYRKENCYDTLIEGASEGLVLIKSILPSLIILLTGISMLRASGAVDILSSIAAPLFRFLGIPPECAMLVLIRPISGSAALAVGAELMQVYGVDSLIGRTAAVMLGSTETTFYVISVYFGSVGIRKTRYALPAALFADFVGFFTASLTARYL